MTQIVVALITLLGVIITGALAILNTRISKKMEKIGVQKSSNDRLELQNNIIEQLLPVFEKKDYALDRIADILEQMLRRQEMLEIEIKNFDSLLLQRCEAPALLKEVRRLQKRAEAEKDNRAIIEELLDGEEVDLGEQPSDKE